MSLDYRFYCHDCKVRTETVGNWKGFFHNHTEFAYRFLIEHSGHLIEFKDFSAKANCDGTCYDSRACDGDCYKEVKL